MQVKKDIIIRKDKENFLVYNPENAEIFKTSEVGKDIIENLDSKTKDEIIQFITEKYDITKNVASKDFDSFFKTLRDEKIIGE